MLIFPVCEQVVSPHPLPLLPILGEGINALAILDRLAVLKL
jgi:hypothetical protein